MNTNLPDFRDEAMPRAGSNAPPKSRWKSLAFLAAIVSASLVVSVIVCGGLLYLGMTGVGHRAPTDAERQCVITVADLEPFGAGASQIEQREVWQAKRSLDGSLEIEYEYDPALASGPGDDISVISSVEIHRSEASARQSFGLSISAIEVGFRVSGCQSRPQSHTMAGVDQSHFAIIEKNERPVGNLLVVRQGKRLHSLLVVGLYFEEPQQLEALMQPAVRSSESLRAR